MWVDEKTKEPHEGLWKYVSTIDSISGALPESVVNVVFVEGGRFNWTKEPLRPELVREYLCTRANTEWRGFTVEYTQWDPATEDTIFEYLQGGVDHECSHL